MKKSDQFFFLSLTSVEGKTAALITYLTYYFSRRLVIMGVLKRGQLKRNVTPKSLANI